MNKRAIIAIILMALVAAEFWGTSRYPTLMKRASLQGKESIVGVLSFSAIMTVNDSQPLVQRIVYSTINWVNANITGMRFAIIFAALVMTLFTFIRFNEGKNPFINSMKGAAMGTPLGVCANCVAPIGKSMFESGFKTETTLSAMISSPTMNVVILPMVFAMFPLKMALIKVALNVILILIIMPLLAKNSGIHEKQVTHEATINEGEGWVAATLGCVTEVMKKLFYVIKTTVPGMVLAGFLGSALILVVPLGQMQMLGQIPMIGMIISIAALSLMCTFLPVPISFDVVLAYMLMTMGLPLNLVMVVLLTIGTYSVYSFFIISTTMSPKLALQTFLAVAALGFVGGLAMLV